MSNSEIHEQYGWLAFKEGFFYEWRDEVNKRLLNLNPLDHLRDNLRAELSIIVYDEMTNTQYNLELGE